MLYQPLFPATAATTTPTGSTFNSINYIANCTIRYIGNTRSYNRIHSHSTVRPTVVLPIGVLEVMLWRHFSAASVERHRAAAYIAYSTQHRNDATGTMATPATPGRYSNNNYTANCTIRYIRNTRRHNRMHSHSTVRPNVMLPNLEDDLEVIL